MKLFEKINKRIKAKRFDDFIEHLNTLCYDIEKSPINLLKIKAKGGQYTGIMRYYIYSNSEELAPQIEKQLRRLRVMRVLAVFFLTILIASGILAYKQGCSTTNIFFIASSLILFSLTLWMVIYRLNKFNESIERAYCTLIKAY